MSQTKLKKRTFSSSISCKGTKLEEDYQMIVRMQKYSVQSLTRQHMNVANPSLIKAQLVMNKTVQTISFIMD